MPQQHDGITLNVISKYTLGISIRLLSSLSRYFIPGEHLHILFN